MCLLSFYPTIATYLWLYLLSGHDFYPLLELVFLHEVQKTVVRVDFI